MQLNHIKIVDSSTGWKTLDCFAGQETTAYATKDGKTINLKTRIRWALGTKKAGEAENRKDWIVRCVSEGVESSLWPALRDALPRLTFDRLCELVGYQPVEASFSP